MWDAWGKNSRWRPKIDDSSNRDRRYLSSLSREEVGEESGDASPVWDLDDTRRSARGQQLACGLVEAKEAELPCTWQGRLEQQPELLLEIGSNWTARGERVSERVSERRARGEREAGEERRA